VVRTAAPVGNTDDGRLGSDGASASQDAPEEAEAQSGRAGRDRGGGEAAVGGEEVGGLDLLGVDSAVTIFGASGISKVFEDSEKLYQLAMLPVGIATYGAAGMEGRTIGSFLREFEVRSHGMLGAMTVEEITEALRSFFYDVYVRFWEAVFAQPFDQIAPDHKGTLGLIVGGFSPSIFLSEVREITIPLA
jgi:hypothetical protein